MIAKNPPYLQMVQNGTNKNKGLTGGAAVVQSNDSQQDKLALNATLNLEKADELAKFDNQVPKRTLTSGGKRKKVRKKSSPKKKKKKTKKKRKKKTKKKRKKVVRRKSSTRRKRIYKLRFSKMVPLKF